MVSVNPNPAQGFFFFDPMNTGHPGLNSLPPSNNYNATTMNRTATDTASTKSTSANKTSFAEDPSKKIRKPYTITKSRESWTEQEHDKFLEALQLFDRDWKKIEAFIGSKTVIQVYLWKNIDLYHRDQQLVTTEDNHAIGSIQFIKPVKSIEYVFALHGMIRSHAQKYFLKVQKNGTSEHVPPPRPKRKAAHPYPQKAPKTAPGVSQVCGPFQSSASPLETGYIYRPDSSSVLGNPIPGAALSSWSYNSVPTVSMSQATKDDVRFTGPTIAQNCCYSSTNEGTPRTWPASEMTDQGDHGKIPRVMPDFAQVYSFLGSVFDPNATGHLQKLKQMDPISFETVLLLMRNLTINLTSPEFENHRRLLSLYDVEQQRTKFGSPYDIHAGKPESAIPSA